ncbi:lamin tail domain-containing protein [Methylobacter sp. S3L5C]|uniref:lamin tail domain-containing protein n=1 Tax=Methylobacter sp. S3L5C TaxID=2839024 RepID=UPI001FAC5A80|nr:lamin tail domain-containing protein [Methylobacter sp. S3L5C]
MNNKTIVKLLAAGAMLSGLINTAEASVTNVKITEWMYNSNAGEFIEFTNLGSTAVNFAGWSFDDASRAPNSVTLSDFGLIGAGESVILTELTATAFRTEWNLSSNIKVIGNNTQNLGRSDEINLYDNTNTLIDRLTYNDAGTGNVKGPRTQYVSGIPGSLAALGANNASLWALSTVGNLDGAYLSLSGDIASPGKTSFAVSAVPVPAAVWLFSSALAALGFVGRRKKA